MSTFIAMAVFAPMIVGHYLGDFVFQSSWMATNKSSEWRALSAHVLTYTLLLFLPVFVVWTWLGIGWMNIIFWVLMNGVLHFIVDAVTSRLAKMVGNKEDEGYFWMVIGADQMIHHLCLLATFFLCYGYI